MKYIAKTETLIIIIFISICIVGSNLPAIDLDYLVHDDSYFYYLYSYGIGLKARLSQAFEYYPLLPYIEMPIYEIMVRSSPTIARLTNVLVYAIPSSFCLFILHKKIWGTDSFTAIYCAVTPFVLFFIQRMPAGINISYSLPSLLGISILMIISWLYVNKKTKENKKLLFFFYTFVLVSTSLYSPNAPFILSGLLVLLSCYWVAGHKNTIWMIGLTAIALSQRLFSAFVNARPGKSIEFSLETTLNRIDIFLENYILPLPMAKYEIFSLGVTPLVLASILILVIMSTLFSKNTIFDCPKHFSKFGVQYLPVFYLIFCLSWIFFTSISYLTIVSTLPQARYFWLTSIGFAPLIPIAVRFLLELLRLKNQLLVYKGILTFLLLMICFNNYNFSSKQKYYRENITNNIRNNMADLKFPKESQVIYITDYYPSHPGISKPNRGFLMSVGASSNIKYAMIFPHKAERYWYDPFKQESQSWRRPPISGIKLSKPLFVFKDVDKKFKPITKILQVDSNTKYWKIYSLSSKGQISLYTEGYGEKEYLSLLTKELDIEDASINEYIVFGNFLNR